VICTSVGSWLDLIVTDETKCMEDVTSAKQRPGRSETGRDDNNTSISLN